MTVADYRPNQLTTYLFDLANRYSTFFEQCHVLCRDRRAAPKPLASLRPDGPHDPQGFGVVGDRGGGADVIAMKLLDFLHRRFGRYAVANLTLILICCQVMTYGLQFVQPEMLKRMAFVPQKVLEGEWWRSFLFWPIRPVLHRSGLSSSGTCST